MLQKVNLPFPQFCHSNLRTMMYCSLCTGHTVHWMGVGERLDPTKSPKECTVALPTYVRIPATMFCQISPWVCAHPESSWVHIQDPAGEGAKVTEQWLKVEDQSDRAGRQTVKNQSKGGGGRLRHKNSDSRTYTHTPLSHGTSLIKLNGNY